MDCLVLGIDPGFTGALAVYDFAHPDSAQRLVNIYDMPLLQPVDPLFGQTSTRPCIDAPRLSLMLAGVARRCRLAVLERVHAMPHDGVASAFRFGEGFGLLQGALAAFGIKTLLPLPAVWKATLGLSYDKNLSMALARKTFGPMNTAKYFMRKKDHGRAEAALLAHYGARALNL